MKSHLIKASLMLAVTSILCSSAYAAVDAVAAKQLARKDSCLRCHAVAKKKEGPSYQAVAYKYKDNPEAQAILFKHLTIGDKIKASDGTDQIHKIAKAKNDDDINNLISWILAQ